MTQIGLRMLNLVTSGMTILNLATQKMYSTRVHVFGLVLDFVIFIKSDVESELLVGRDAFCKVWRLENDEYYFL